MTPELSDRERIALLTEALLRVLFEDTHEGRTGAAGDAFEQANDALLAAGAYAFHRPDPTCPNLILRERDGDRSVELWEWSRLERGWAGCRVGDEPPCYFPADKWEQTNDAPEYRAGAGPLASSRLTSLLARVVNGAGCSSLRCPRSATHILVAPNGEPEPAPGAMVCEPCARFTIGDFLTRWGQRWHAVAPISERTPRDRLVSTLLDRLDGGVADLDAHARAMKEARAGLAEVHGVAQAEPLRIEHDGSVCSLADWYPLSSGWFGRDVASGRDGFFSETHWAEATAPAGSGAR